MAEWNGNNRACTNTWTTLRVLNQNKKVFKVSGTIKMNKLTFWNQVSSAAMRKVQANTLANMMDNIFRMVRKATFEKKVTKAKAVNSMVKILCSEKMTIADLAEVADTNYLFWKEEK